MGSAPNNHLQSASVKGITCLLHFVRISRERKKNGLIFSMGTICFFQRENFYIFFWQDSSQEGASSAVMPAAANEICLQVLLCCLPSRFF